MRYLGILFLVLTFFVGGYSSQAFADENKSSINLSENLNNIAQISADNLSKDSLDLNTSLNPQNLNTTAKDLNSSQSANEVQENSLNPQEHSLNSQEINFISLYEQAHIVVKVVIYILCLFSIISWTIFIGKFLQFMVIFSSLQKGVKFIRNLNTLDENGINGLTKELILIAKKEISLSKSQDQALKSRIKHSFEGKISNFLFGKKAILSSLASISSSSPFIGLFGTVWGIMNSFINIASAKTASLAVVAPGIAEALFATALGLGAAIPALLFYNYLTRLAARLSNDLNQIANELYILSDRQISNGFSDDRD